MKNKKISGAEAVVHSLLNEGVDLIWGYPGGAIMPVYDEFYKFQYITFFNFNIQMFFIICLY